MEHKQVPAWLKAKHVAAKFALALGAIAATAVPATAVAQTWDPTLLVNTEAFIQIDDGDGSEAIELQFGSDESIILGTDGAFDLTGGLAVQGDLSASGSLTVNADQTDDATLTFGNATADQTLTYSDADSQFEFSADLEVTADIDATGAITAGSSIEATTTVTAGTDVIAGNDVTAVNDISAGNDIIAAGTLSGDVLEVNSAVITTDSVSVNGVAYSFPSAQGAANEILFNDGDGNLSWGNINELGLQVTGSGATFAYHPEFPNSTYEGDGTLNVGQLKLVYDDTDDQNYYQWTTRKTAAQSYDIVLRNSLPSDFNAWEASAITYAYKTDTANTAENNVAVTVYDTAGASAHADGVQASASAATETITSAELAGGTWTAGSDYTIRINIEATKDNDAFMGYVQGNFLRDLINS